MFIFMFSLCLSVTLTEVFSCVFYGIAGELIPLFFDKWFVLYTLKGVEFLGLLIILLQIYKSYKTYKSYTKFQEAGRTSNR